MTPNRRIFLNVVASYARSLYALVVGLFTARWVLMALGEVDFGLYGVVGGLTSFVAFVNGLLSSAVARFFAVSVGAASKAANPSEGIENSRKWFNTALALHMIVPIVLVIVGWPVGEWAVRCFLTIPPMRIEACVWVWRYTCISCFVGMATAPFQAMYTAKQEIAEMTIYNFFSTTAIAVVLYYMVSHPGDWLKDYALWMCVIGVLPNVLLSARALVKYPECCIASRYFFDWSRLREIFIFAAARFFSSFSDILVSQGQQVLVNKYIGPSCNAAMRVGNTVASQTATLAGSLGGAFWPAIANAAGAGEDDRVRRMSFQVCRMTAVLISIFAIPLALEAHKVLELWLKTPPDHAAEICIFILVGMVIGRLTEGYWMAVMGFGRRIPFYSWWVSWSGFVGFGATWLLLASRWGVWSICAAIIVNRLITTGVRLWLGRLLAGLSVKYWLMHVFLPIVMLVGLTFVIAQLPLWFMERSFLRICITTFCSEVVLLPLAWIIVLTAEERNFISSRVFRLVSKLRS